MLTEEGKGQTNWELSARGADEASKMSTWSGNDLSSRAKLCVSQLKISGTQSPTFLVNLSDAFTSRASAHTVDNLSLTALSSCVSFPFLATVRGAMFFRSHETNLFTQQYSLYRRPKSNYETRCLVYILRAEQSESQAVTCVIYKESIAFEKENQLTCIKGSAPQFVYRFAFLLKQCCYQTTLLLQLLSRRKRAVHRSLNDSDSLRK